VEEIGLFRPLDGKRPTRSYIFYMAPTPNRTFGDLDREGLEVEVVCQKCGHQAVLNGRAPELQALRISSRRYRCSQPGCRGIGLPSIAKKQWVKRLADHARALQASPSRKG
jgi:hypothetical protein